jgi:malonyl-CoA O-methyltransferase
MNDDSAIDKRQLRRSFEEAAATYEESAALQHEVCRRMLERLLYIKLQPGTILDVGSGTGNALPALLQRYPRAHIVALDLAIAMLERGRARLPWWRGLPGLRPAMAWVGADMERLPIATSTIDMVWSNLALQWVNQLPAALSEMHRVLTPGGLLMFSTFGPDTLKEMRASYEGIPHRHINRFIDMHDIGDVLIKLGYADPVMDMELFTLTYDDVRQLMRELKAIGARNVMIGRPAGLTGRHVLQTVAQKYEAFRRDGKLPATFEVIYGHAWKPEPRLGPSGRPVIDIKVKGT